MTSKFQSLKEKNLNLHVPIFGEEPVLIQFEHGFFETDDDYIAVSLRGFKEEYGKLFIEVGDEIKPEPVPKKEILMAKIKARKKSKRPRRKRVG